MELEEQPFGFVFNAGFFFPKHYFGGCINLFCHLPMQMFPTTTFTLSLCVYTV
jgi:hypothetical protein